MTDCSQSWRRAWLALVAALACTSWGGGAGKATFEDYRDGDIVLQHIKVPLGEVIKSATESPYSHCGLVVHRKGKPFVLEAIGPVRYISLRRWLAQGHRGRVTVVRVTDLEPGQAAKAIQVAEGFLGKPYDIQYQVDDARIYCSELVYKAFERGCGIAVGELDRLGDLKWGPHEAFIRNITGGELPLNRRMITPVALVKSPRTVVVHSTFPARSKKPAGKGKH